MNSAILNTSRYTPWHQARIALRWSLRMTRRQKDPLRPLTQEEHSILDEISRARSEPASHGERATILLAVADGATYTAAARAVGRRANDGVADVVARCNR